MRYKFRALEAASKEWVYGYYVVLDSGFEMVECIWQLGAERATPIDPDTLGQFTGLTDVNGREIYEGDIILFQTFSNWDDESMKRHKATVIFKEGCFMWDILKFGKKSVTYYANAKEPLRNTNSIWGLEVIGNIHENPELLTD